MSTVIKKDLVHAITQRTRLTQREAGEVLDVILTTLTERLASGDSIALRGFGSFTLRAMRSRLARNPSRPSETVEIPSRVVMRFKPSPRLRDSVSQLAPESIMESGDGEEEE